MEEWCMLMEINTDPRYGVKIRHIESSNDGDICIAMVTQTLLKNKKDPLCIDIGMDKGWWSFFVLDTNPTSSVIGFEPNPLSYKSLLPYIENETRITVNNVAISDKEGILPFSLKEGESHSRDTSSNITVPCRPIHSYIKDKTIELMKIDTEGHELFILSTLRPHFKYINTIIFEFSPNWYNNLEESIRHLKYLLTVYPVMYSLSRRGRPILSPLLPTNIDSFVIVSINNKIQFDILCTNDNSLLVSNPKIIIGSLWDN